MALAAVFGGAAIQSRGSVMESPAEAAPDDAVVPEVVQARVEDEDEFKVDESMFE